MEVYMTYWSLVRGELHAAWWFPRHDYITIRGRVGYLVDVPQTLSNTGLLFIPSV